jgi:hypothetical protein
MTKLLEKATKGAQHGALALGLFLGIVVQIDVDTGIKVTHKVRAEMRRCGTVVVKNLNI